MRGVVIDLNTLMFHSSSVQVCSIHTGISALVLSVCVLKQPLDGSSALVHLQSLKWTLPASICVCRVIEVVVRLLLMGVCGRTVIGFLKN